MCLGAVGQITAVTGAGADRNVEVRTGGRDLTASLLAIDDELRPGDWVLVHSGLVLSRLTEEEALDALDLRDPTNEGAR